ncbi:MAG: GspH/FimT family pseudopilin [Candidatus Binatia bacterium]|nr:GspH/FimT family pseudopilin [Candidatus Binatia bacterium]
MLLAYSWSVITKKGLLGFTLMEFVATLALLGVTGSFALSHWAQWRERMALRTAARQVMLDLFSIRLRAAATNRSHRIVFSPGSTTYQKQWRPLSTYTNLGGAVALPAGVRVVSCNASGQAIAFKPRGNAATFGTVVLRNGFGEEKHIIVDIAGRVRLQ